LAVVLW